MKRVSRSRSADDSSMENQRPGVSIGIPVFNGERHLELAIDSFLAQTFSNFELIISDNGSTDGTKKICENYVAKDPRIRYFRSDVNRGAAWNFNFVFEVSFGEYFKWAAHDDICEPTFLQKSVDVLDNYPEIVLCRSWLKDIDDNNETIQVRKHFVPFSLPQVHKRFWHLAMVHPAHSCEEIFGLIRRDVLAKTGLIRDYADSDRTLLAELGLYGPFHEIPEVLFLHRLHSGSSVSVNPSRRERMLWFDPDLKDQIFFPWWIQLSDLIKIVGKGPISPVERIYCYLYLLRWMKRTRKYLFRDLHNGMNDFVRRIRKTLFQNT